MDSGIAALLGALVGGGATVMANYMLTRAQNRQRRVQAATELAIKEHEFDVLLRKEGKKLDYSLLAAYVAYHNAALQRLENGLQNTPAELESLAETHGVA